MIRWYLGYALVIALFLLTSCTTNHVTNINVENVYVRVDGNAIEVKP